MVSCKWLIRFSDVEAKEAMPPVEALLPEDLLNLKMRDRFRIETEGREPEVSYHITE